MINLVNNVKTIPLCFSGAKKPENLQLKKDELKIDFNYKNLDKILVDLTPEQALKISNMGNIEAAQYSFNLICDSMSIPKELRPKFKVEEINKTNPSMLAQSVGLLSDSEIQYYSKTNENMPKWHIFGLMRHEMEHYKNYISLYRIDELADEFEDRAKKIVSKATQKDLIEDGYANTDEAIKDLEQKSKDYRTKVRKYYPPIKEGSFEYKKQKKIWASAMNFNPKNKLEYLFSAREYYCCEVQGLNWINFQLKKFLSLFKQKTTN